MQDERTTAAIAYLASVGVALRPAPMKWQRRGFTHHATDAHGLSQMLTDAQIVEFADNDRQFRA